jgi:hypothetical protein
MKTILIIATLIMLWFIGGHADASSCQQTKDSDLRAYCEAVRTGQKSYCTTIKNYDVRQTCLVRLGSPNSNCSLVQSGWPRVQCQDAARITKSQKG